MITWYTFVKPGMIKLYVQRLNHFVSRTNTTEFDHKSNARNGRYFDILKGYMCQIVKIEIIFKCQYARKLIEIHTRWLLN